MIEFLEKLKLLFPNAEFMNDDILILEKCLDVIYTEDDFIYACKKLFEETKKKNIKIFKNKNIFIKYRNMHRDIFPDWICDLSLEDQENLKDTYRDIISYCLLDHTYYKCNYPEILLIIQGYHKEGIPYWCIRGCVKENLNCYYPIKKNILIEFLNKGNNFKDMCRKIFKKVQDFKNKNPEIIKNLIKGKV
jgi:hypothetical protein